VARRTPSGRREPALAGLTVLVLVVLPRRETAISLFDECALVLLADPLA
jgi:hypothetical protein